MTPRRGSGELSFGSTKPNPTQSPVRRSLSNTVRFGFWFCKLQGMTEGKCTHLASHHGKENAAEFKTLAPAAPLYQLHSSPRPIQA